MLGTTDIVAIVPTRDNEKARAFYETVLGLKFVSHDGFAQVFDANGIMLRITKVGEFTPPQHTVLGWNVKDIAQTVITLRDRGVHFETFGFFKQDELGIWTAPNGEKVAWFKDPDGNTLSVSQHRPER